MKPFKKSKLFCFSEDLTPEEIEVGLKKLPLHPTTPAIKHTHGFVNADHYLTAQGNFLVKLYGMHLAVMCFEKRTPSNIAVAILADKKKREFLKTGEKVTQKIERKLRKEASEELAQKADPQQSFVNIAFDFKDKKVVIDTTANKEIEKILDMLSKIGVNLKAENLHFDIHGLLEQIVDEPEKVLSSEFEVGTSLQMRDDSKKKATVAYKNQDIINQEVSTNREKHKSPTAVGLQYKSSIEFTLHNVHTITGVRAFNADNSYFTQLLEKIRIEEFGDETRTDFFQKVGVMLVTVQDIYRDFLAMTNSSDEIKQYMVQE